MINTIGLDNLSCWNGCLYKDANNAQEYLITKLVSILANHKNSGLFVNLISEAAMLIY